MFGTGAMFGTLLLREQFADKQFAHKLKPNRFRLGVVLAFS